MKYAYLYLVARLVAMVTCIGYYGDIHWEKVGDCHFDIYICHNSFYWNFHHSISIVELYKYSFIYDLVTV